MTAGRRGGRGGLRVRELGAALMKRRVPTCPGLNGCCLRPSCKARAASHSQEISGSESSYVLNVLMTDLASSATILLVS